MSINSLSERSISQQSGAAGGPAQPPDAKTFLADLAAYIPGDILLLFSFVGPVIKDPHGTKVLFGFNPADEVHWIRLFTILTPIFIYLLAVFKARERNLSAVAANSIQNPWKVSLATLWYMFSGALAFVVWSNAITKGIKDLNQIDVLLLALTSVGLAFFGRIFIRE